MKEQDVANDDDDPLKGIDLSKIGGPKKNLAEMIAAIGEQAQGLDDEVAKVLKDHPDLWAFDTDARGRSTVANYKLGRIVAICIMNFVCRAYGRPDLGYQRQIPRERGH
jgi:hypothetical protein